MNLVIAKFALTIVEKLQILTDHNLGAKSEWKQRNESQNQHGDTAGCAWIQGTFLSVWTATLPQYVFMFISTIFFVNMLGLNAKWSGST